LPVPIEPPVSGPAIRRHVTLEMEPWCAGDLVNAGARYEDREVVRDGNRVTSRKPETIFG